MNIPGGQSGTIHGKDVKVKLIPNQRHSRKNAMTNHVYKKIEITGTSSASTEEAIRNAITRAAQTVKNMRWFEVVETRGTIEDGGVSQWQVTVKVGFTLNE